MYLRKHNPRESQNKIISCLSIRFPNSSPPNIEGAVFLGGGKVCFYKSDVVWMLILCEMVYLLIV